MDHEQLVRCLLAERARVLGFTRAILGRWEGSEDVFQEACLLALAKSAGIQDEQHLLAWIRLTCRNLCREQLRRRGQSAIALDDQVLDLLESHWSRQSQKSSDGIQALTECLGRLAQKSRELVRQRYVDGLSVEEIAARLKRPVSSVYVTFSRINAALADCVQQQLRLVRSIDG